MKYDCKECVFRTEFRDMGAVVPCCSFFLTRDIELDVLTYEVCQNSSVRCPYLFTLDDARTFVMKKNI